MLKAAGCAMSAADKLTAIVGELGAAQVHLGRARDALKRRRADLVPVVDRLQAQVWSMAIDLAAATRQVDAWGRDKKCLNCKESVPPQRGAGRPKKFCGPVCAQAWHCIQRKLARARR